MLTSLTTTNNRKETAMAIETHSTPSGVDEPGLPHSRRAFCLALGSLPMVAAPKALAGTSTFATHPNDLLLASLADQLEALFAKAEAYVSTLDDISDDPILNDLISQYSPLEEYVIDTKAMSFFGIMAKVRAVKVPSVYDCSTGEQIAVSIVDDLARLCLYDGRDV